jgi:hypothetical protein
LEPTYYTGESNNIRARLKADYNIPDARPILNDMMYTFLLEGGDGKYYLWNNVSDDVDRIEEPNNLPEILARLGREGLQGLKCTILTE